MNARHTPAEANAAATAPSPWATVVGGVYLCTMYGIAYEKRRRSDLAFADALLLVWLFGPAIPWAGEVP